MVSKMVQNILNRRSRLYYLGRLISWLLVLFASKLLLNIASYHHRIVQLLALLEFNMSLS